MKKAKTLFDKIWDEHKVTGIPGGPDVLYIDKHLIHEVTSPQAFAGLEKRGISVFRKEQTLATADHNVPTINQHLPIREEMSRLQVSRLVENCRKHEIELFGLGHPNQGIVHVIAPELGITLPGMTMVCGDSHTSTHGGLGALAFGIGSTEVEQVFASQCLLQERPPAMKICVTGEMGPWLSSKDLILYIISQASTDAATGHFVEYMGSAISALSIEERMTVCNMSIEMGARGGIIAPDDKTLEYIRNRPFAPKGKALEAALERWKELHSDEGAFFARELHFDITGLAPMVTYGTNPGMGIAVDSNIPVLNNPSDRKALEYMGWQGGEPVAGKKLDYVFIGSCTNSRIEDLRIVAAVVKGKKVSQDVIAFIVPGSQRVRQQAKSEGLEDIFLESGFEFRESGCSACLGMNEDKIPPLSYCMATSNRNFEGRQGPGARTILASPATAAASAINGYITDIRMLAS